LNKKALVVGYGSIGKRHTRELRNLGFEVDIVSSHAKKKKVNNLKDVADFSVYDCVVLSSETHLHERQYQWLCEKKYTGKMIVEKPVGFLLEEGNCVYPAYNLRFHGGVKKLKDELLDKSCIHAQMNISRHLPTMREGGRPYGESYSCSKAKGGGVLCDFSHDLDLLIHLFGPCKKLIAHGGKLSSLEGDSYDCVTLLCETEKCPSLCLHLDYVDHFPERTIKVSADEDSIYLNLDEHYYCSSKEEIQFDEDELEQSYVEQLKAVLADDKKSLCSISDSNKTEKLIEAIEHSLETKVWVNL